MHTLESKLLDLSVDLERGTVSPRRAAQKLRSLASFSHYYLWDDTVPGNPDGMDSDNPENPSYRLTPL